MADDNGPTTSYSDPFYDRLDLLAQQVRRQWALVVLVILIFIGVGITIQVAMTSRPEAAAANAYLDALQEREPAKAEAALAAVLNGTGTPHFRAKAGIDLTELRLRTGDLAGARTAAQSALLQAQAAEEPDLVFAAQLTVGAVAEQAGDTAAAESAARQVYGAAAAFPATRLAAQLALARALEQAGRPQEAVELLEPLLTRTDSGAGRLLDLAAVEYWRLRRDLAASATAAR
jgi:HPt (histidine-containing phosphotransfer) domain-containing protein